MIPGTRSKSASLLARLAKPFARITAMIRASPVSSSYRWLARVAASTTGWVSGGNLDAEDSDSLNGL